MEKVLLNFTANSTMINPCGKTKKLVLTH